MVDWASHQAAVFACKHWHYSKTMPVPPHNILGAWENDRFIGVVIFSRGASPELLNPYGLKQNQGCELTRIALCEHKTPVSKIMSIAIKFLKKHNPGLRLIVSFADSNQGHHGGIYQAANWVYSGKSSSSVEYYKDGKRLHSRQVSVTGYRVQFGDNRKVPKPSECEKKILEGKHRYLMPLDDKMKKLIELMKKPYPKRAESKAIVAPEFHSGEGSETLTSALQNKC